MHTWFSLSSYPESSDLLSDPLGVRPLLALDAVSSLKGSETDSELLLVTTTIVTLGEGLGAARSRWTSVDRPLTNPVVSAPSCLVPSEGRYCAGRPEQVGCPGERRMVPWQLQAVACRSVQC